MGRGIISISNAALVDALKLPDDYKIHHISYEYGIAHILVESETITEVQKGLPYPTLTPVYKSEPIRHITLVEVLSSQQEEQHGDDRV